MISKLELAVLFVEDEETILDCMGIYFKRRFRDVYLAADGAEGLEKFREYRPDLVVTDIEMPKLDGLEMSKEIRKISPDTPIILTTAYNEDAQVEEGKRIGVSAYLLKPVDYADLDGVIATLFK
jgi:YesN/AraC family two-component response regulator